MPTHITLSDPLAERLAVLAAEDGQPVDIFVQRLLQGLADADIDLRDGIPVLRMPSGSPIIRREDVQRLLHRDIDPE